MNLIKKLELIIISKKKGNGVYAFLIDGSVKIDGESLEKRDALGVWDTENFELLANQNSRILLIEVPLNY